MVVIAVLVIAFAAWFFMKKSPSTDPAAGKPTAASSLTGIDKARALYDSNSNFKNAAEWAKGQDYIREKANKNGVPIMDQALLDTLWMVEQGTLKI